MGDSECASSALSDSATPPIAYCLFPNTLSLSIFVFVPHVFDYLIPIALGVVFLILCFGIYTLFRGGDFGRTWSNRAMRMRVVAQFVAVLILLAALLAKSMLK